MLQGDDVCLKPLPEQQMVWYLVQWGEELVEVSSLVASCCSFLVEQPLGTEHCSTRSGDQVCERWWFIRQCCAAVCLLKKLECCQRTIPGTLYLKLLCVVWCGACVVSVVCSAIGTDSSYCFSRDCCLSWIPILPSQCVCWSAHCPLHTIALYHSLYLLLTSQSQLLCLLSVCGTSVLMKAVGAIMMLAALLDVLEGNFMLL